MKTSTLGKTGLKVTQLGFGSAPIGFLKTDQDQANRLLNFLLDSGVNVIDTAAMYEGAEEMIGKAIAHRRDQFVLVSKCGTKVPDVEGRLFSKELISGTVDRALKRLKTDHLDVMLLHSCDLPTLQKGEALAALVEAQKAGKIRYVGYSGDNDAAACAAAMPEIAVLETSINIADQANIDHALPIAVKNNVGVLAKRPIANAAWKDISEQKGMYQSYAKEYTTRLAAMKITPADLGFAGDARETWPQVALRFTLSQHGVCTAIIGTTSMKNAQANLDAAAAGPLPNDVLIKLKKAFKSAESAGGKKWDGQI